MAGSPAVASRSAQSPGPSNTRRKRNHAELETIPASSSAAAVASSSNSQSGTTTTNPIDLTDEPRLPSRKQRRLNSATTATIPRTLPMEPHAEVLAELQGKYVLLTATVISSSKIEKKVTAVLKHLGHIDLSSRTCVPGVVMLHARAGETNKLVTVMELAKRRLHETGSKWYQYNRVYEAAEKRRVGDVKKSEKDKGNNQLSAAKADDSIMVIEDTLFEKEGEDEANDEADAFEATTILNDLKIGDKPPTENKNAFMSIFLTRVPMPELAAKTSYTLQTNAAQIGSRK